MLVSFSLSPGLFGTQLNKRGHHVMIVWPCVHGLAALASVWLYQRPASSDRPLWLTLTVQLSVNISFHIILIRITHTWQPPTDIDLFLMLRNNMIFIYYLWAYPDSKPLFSANTSHHRKLVPYRTASHGLSDLLLNFLISMLVGFFLFLAELFIYSEQKPSVCGSVCLWH